MVPTEKTKSHNFYFVGFWTLLVGIVLATTGLIVKNKLDHDEQIRINAEMSKLINESLNKAHKEFENVEYPWEGRYENYVKGQIPSPYYVHVPLAIRLSKEGSIYKITGFRGGDTTERIEGVFDPETLQVTGKFIYKPRGTSKLLGTWRSESGYFEITDNQWDATLTYYLKPDES